MAIRNRKNLTDNKTKKKREPNWLLRFTIIVFIVPLIILVFVLLTSMESSNSPVVGDRFKNQLNPAISDSQIEEVKNSLTYNEVESVEVNLISATLRITINCKDDITSDQIMAIVEDAYNKVDSILPISTYFTNSNNTKMYDVEISAYNFIADGNNNGEVYISKEKSGAAKEATTDVISSPKNEEVSDTLLNN